ncbi:U1 small nuclear ribonucleo protein [Aulographum hederae CBS 113979]|uniref:U1 small nuclear ribonucleo protein n=1 Tax=Aulographum hederae CBS 113979 TaxID=1176131 RepID=A0A6G1HC53_9PEZI|nr:U1 small nuclear ribonucleo protein [Aulographum hederae CBS 113979]
MDTVMTGAEAPIAPNHTVYVSNLEESIKIPDLVTGLEEIFSDYGNVVEIVAKRSIRRKGQAFVVYDSVNSATTAIEEIDGFPFNGKEMKLAYAKTRSDATVKREEDPEAFEKHKRARLAAKEHKQAQEAAATVTSKKRPADEEPETAKPTLTKKLKGAGLKPTGAPGQVPDEYLPPNKILIVRDIAEGFDNQLALTNIFDKFKGFREVRTVPTRSDIAFVEYESDAAAIEAKSQTNGMALGDTEKALRVTFQRA